MLREELAVAKKKKNKVDPLSNHFKKMSLNLKSISVLSTQRKRMGLAKYLIR